VSLAVLRGALTAAAVLAGVVATRLDARTDTLSLDTFPRERIVVETRSAQRHEFRAWRADTPETRSQGLMYIAEMDPDQAMIFVYDEPQPVSMWMKNTYLPLDMLFVDRRGCVVKVTEHATPLSQRTIASGQPVQVVVELKGGTVGELGIAAGDRLRRIDSGWPSASRSSC
jgi:uncharacterized membrane protein (UPF0127 family)